MEDKKDTKVTSLHIGRKPIISSVRKALDAISWGGFSKAKKRLGYTDVYHNYLIAGLEDGTFHKLERNHIIENKKATNADLANELLDIPLDGKDLTLDQMVENAGGNKPEFWKYRARDNNCQNFTRDMIEKNGLLPDAAGESIDAYTPQDSKTMLDALPNGLKWIPDLVTDIAGGADRATSLVASGVKPKKKQRGKGKMNLMGSKSCKLSGDKVEIKSPILGCIIEHCTCSCDSEPKEPTKGTERKKTKASKKGVKK